MANILDLPVEILYKIFQLLKSKTSWPKISSLFSNLCLVSRRFHTFSTPYAYKQVVIIDNLRRLELFYNSLDSNPKLGYLVEAVNIHFPGKNNNQSSLEKEEDRGQAKLEDILQRILLLLPKLRNLSLYQTSHAGVDHSTGLELFVQSDVLKQLTRLSLLGFYFEPGNLRRPYLLENLQCLVPLGDMQVSVCLDSKFTSQYPQISNLEYRTSRHFPAPPNRVLISTLNCFDVLESVKLIVGAEIFDDGALRSALMCLQEKVCIRSLTFRVHHLSETRVLEVDLSKWKCLQELNIDSALLWSWKESWIERESLYKQLPSTLIRLQINFPFIVCMHEPIDNQGDDWVEDSDGVFQVNPQEDFDRERYRNQVIPHSRYTWLLNLLRTRSLGEPYDGCSPYFPTLKHITLHESEIYTEDEDSWANSWNDSQFSLPRDIQEKFEAREIEVDIKTRTYPPEDD